MDALLAALTPRTRILFLANPNNPTGTYISGAEVRRLHAGLPKNVLLVLDEAYEEYVDAADYEDGRALVAANENVVLLRTFSKVYGIPALRLGWGYGPPAIIGVLNRIRGPFNLATPTIRAGIAAVEDQDFVRRSVAHNLQWRGWMSETLAQMGLQVTPSQGNFLLMSPSPNAARRRRMRPCSQPISSCAKSPATASPTTSASPSAPKPRTVRWWNVCSDFWADPSIYSLSPEGRGLGRG